MHTEKNIKNPAVMAELFELSCCTYGFTPESKLSRKPQAQYGFVPKFSHHSGKNKKIRTMFLMFFPRMQSAFHL